MLWKIATECKNLKTMNDSLGFGPAEGHMALQQGWVLVSVGGLVF